MSIKLIAVDMDGTFLNDSKTYNYQRFSNQYARMKEQNIRFVVASGNQYYQLISFFPEIAYEISFVAENGGWIVEKGVDIFNGELNKSYFDIILNKLLQLPDTRIIVCGKRSAYTLKKYGKALEEMASHYYHRLEVVDNFSDINDTFIKVGLSISENRINDTKSVLNTIPSHIVTPVTTGDNNIDLIVPGMHKANGLRILQQRWNIEDSEVVAFGDNGNDVEMLRQVGFGFAMANSKNSIKEAARYEAPNNNNEGVLEIIDKVLNKEAPFY